MGARRRTTRPATTDKPRKFPVVTCVAVDENYNFPCSELVAMAKNISRLIEDIDRLDINRKNMMDELKVLRDATLFYNEQHPELHTAESKLVKEDTVNDAQTRDGDGARTSTPEMQKTPEKTDSAKKQ